MQPAETDSAPPAVCDILGSPVAMTDYVRAVALVKAWAAGRRRAFAAAAANTHVITLARRDAEFRRAMGRFDLILPDGMPLVWVMNRVARAGLDDRVYGPTFMLRCLEASENLGHFLLGGSEELLAVLQAKLRERFPTLNIAGAYSPPFGQWPADEDDKICARIAESGAHFVWVGLGCPKQELWIARNKDRLPPAVYFAIGAAFAFHAGRVRQAPLWMQARGLEWLFRMVTEPRRLARRFLLFNTLFLYHLVRDGALLRRRR
jgi:N-acetylglucosaminyldiphosphoundecaprenol N-acetyl-beta-D-mannosaminyltransferase